MMPSCTQGEQSKNYILSVFMSPVIGCNTQHCPSFCAAVLQKRQVFLELRFSIRACTCKDYLRKQMSPEEALVSCISLNRKITQTETEAVVALAQGNAWWQENPKCCASCGPIR